MRKPRKSTRKILTYFFLVVIAVVMCYPLIWLLFSSFKDNMEILSSIKLLPEKFLWRSYVDGWNGIANMTYSRFFLNTFALVIPSVIFIAVSSSIVAYGFARFKFPFKKTLFAVLLSTLMLPEAVIIIPKYMLFSSFDWLDSYLPFIIPALFAANPFFVFMMVQFLRGIPKDLDESAVIDGCNSFTIFLKIIMPLCRVAIFCVCIFHFIWTWNDFFNQLIYINSVKKFTLSLGLRMSLDTQSATSWNQIMAMSVLSMLPPILVFFFAQKYFVEGIATTGIKG